MTNTLRFVVLQTVLAASLVAMWQAGYLSLLTDGDSRWFVAGVLAFAVIGLGAMAMHRYDHVRFIADQLVIVAVVGMQVGISGGLAAFASSIGMGGELVKLAGAFLGAVSVALHISIAALASYFWLNVNLHLLGADDDRR